LSPALRQAVARGLYATGLRLAVPLWLARLWWRGAREPLSRAHLAERLGFGPPPEATGALWVHAVSLGETRAASALVQAMRARLPGLRLLLTHGTATGREAGRALLQPGDAQAWLPIDTPGAVHRFLARHRPAAGVLMETEVWPVLLHEAQAAAVPMVLANARLSPRSLRRGQRHASLLRPAVASLRLVLAQTDAVLMIGADRYHVAVEWGGRPIFASAIAADPRIAEALRGQCVLAFCGIGRPEKFAETLREIGTEIVRLRAFPDHHAFTESEASALLSEAGKLSATPVTTEKDAMRLAGGPAREKLREAAMVLPISVPLPDELMAAIYRVVDSSRRRVSTASGLE
jgi:3-deoxy-D-manno-octulosonic-acid transferase